MTDTHPPDGVSARNLNALQAPGRDPDEPGTGLVATAVPTAIFLLICVFMAVDVLSDLAEGASPQHLIAEIVIAVLSLAGLVAMWRLLRGAIQRSRDLERALDHTRADVLRWRDEAQELLRGLGVAIDRQFERWGLSPAEREVGVLLLKGLSLKEIAGARRTSERTVRQQALAVYRKAGLAGRAELAAFFLEDLLLPRDARVAAAVAPPGAGS
jgi:DNA-binding CsgD family transcriptional regulator